MNTKDMERLIQNAEQTPSPLEGIAKLFEQMKYITGHLQHLQQGLVGMSHETQAQGLGLQMLMKILVDKKICTKEELQQYHTTHVFQPMKEIMDEIQKQIEETQETAKANQNLQNEIKNLQEKVQEVKEEINTKELKESDVILPSERNKVMRFPSDKQNN